MRFFNIYSNKNAINFIGVWKRRVQGDGRNDNIKQACTDSKYTPFRTKAWLHRDPWL